MGVKPNQRVLLVILVSFQMVKRMYFESRAIHLDEIVIHGRDQAFVFVEDFRRVHIQEISGLFSDIRDSVEAVFCI